AAAGRALLLGVPPRPCPGGVSRARTGALAPAQRLRRNVFGAAALAQLVLGASVSSRRRPTLPSLQPASTRGASPRRRSSPLQRPSPSPSSLPPRAGTRRTAAGLLRAVLDEATRHAALLEPADERERR